MKVRRRNRGSEVKAAPVPAVSQPVPESRQTFFLSLSCSLLGGLLLWTAFPPLNLWPIAWLAPLPWLYLALRPQPMTRFVFWLGSAVRPLAPDAARNPAGHILLSGRIILAAYLAVYCRSFGLCRITCDCGSRWLPPIVWVGLNLLAATSLGFFHGLPAIRNRLASGLQIADTFRRMAEFLMMLVAAAVARPF
jgi:hypothetical protein